ncbi:hypothetical protein AOA12_09150 [Microbacterium sp. No. 7]|nr:hypothetical protein AOA12_09150 [Microbacterium sp. No. 7]
MTPLRPAPVADTLVGCITSIDPDLSATIQRTLALQGEFGGENLGVAASSSHRRRNPGLDALMALSHAWGQVRWAAFGACSGDQIGDQKPPDRPASAGRYR